MSMRKRQEVQEMSRRCLTILAITISITGAAPTRKPALPKAEPAAAAPAQSAVWPEQVGALKRDSVQPAPAPSDAALWEEYGFDAAEQATYSGAGRKLSA